MSSIQPSRRALAIFGVLVMTGLATPALAASKSKKSTRKPKVTPNASREKQEETRLKRECRGRPNAGACMGYTR